MTVGGPMPPLEATATRPTDDGGRRCSHGMRGRAGCADVCAMASRKLRLITSCPSAKAVSGTTWPMGRRCACHATVERREPSKTRKFDNTCRLNVTRRCGDGLQKVRKRLDDTNGQRLHTLPVLRQAATVSGKKTGAAAERNAKNMRRVRLSLYCQSTAS